MIVIRFPNLENKRRALGFLAGRFAFTSWKALSWVDANVWRRMAPKGWFYNVMVTGVKPS